MLLLSFQKLANGLNILFDRRWWWLSLKVRLGREGCRRGFHPIGLHADASFRDGDGIRENRKAFEAQNCSMIGKTKRV